MERHPRPVRNVAAGALGLETLPPRQTPGADVTVNFRTHYRERQDARNLPRLEELVDLELLGIDERTKLHQAGADHKGCGDLDEAPAAPAPKRPRINRDPETEAPPKAFSAENAPVAAAKRTAPENRP